jgi:tRNA modification GTPase
MSQTIVALATPLGRSGIGVIRLSGDDSLSITRQLTRDNQFTPEPRCAVLKNLYDLGNGELLDQALITYFKSPQSFTGEDVIEISCHGSPVLLRQVIDICLKLDARLAEPGEFSLRALANGRMNLSQAEAIRDLIDAQTITSARQAVRQLRGELSSQLQSLKDDLLNIIVVLESSLEFVEDDLPELQTENFKIQLTEIINKLDQMASTFRAGRLLREGLKVVLAGRPNVGKSSIFNSLTGQERAIVTEVAGTTRDTLYESLSIKGIPISLIDTAGLRETFDTVESIGVDRTRRIMADSDLTVIVLDNSQAITDEDRDIITEAKDLNYLIAINKIDLLSKIDLTDFNNSLRIIEISAKTGEGFDRLQNEIVQPFLPQDFSDSGFLISDARHFDLLNRAKSEIESSLKLINERVSEEIILIGLHNGLKYLGEITGETTTEDMLTRIFSTFCIGK